MNLFTFSKKAAMLFTFLLLALFQVVDAANIQSTGAGGLWSNPASWSPAVVPNAGDIVTINSGSPIQMAAPAACATITINAGGILTMISSITVTSSFTVNGTLNCNQGFVFGACNFALANNNSAFLMIGDPNGITSLPTAGNIENTGSRTFPASANYIFNGVANQSTGNACPSTINGGGSLVINNTGATANNIVTITAGASTIQNITLQSGNLSLNGKSITLNGTILNSGGNIDSSVRANGGTFIVQGATITGPTTFYNFTCNSSNSAITTSGINSPLINGTLLIGNARFGGTNSPRYAKGSTLSYAGSPNNRGLEWNADLSTTPTIGVTQGYPDNVLINSGSDFDVCNYPLNGNDGAIPRGLDGDLTTSAFTMLDWIPYSTPGPYYLNPLLNQTGSFTVGHNMIVNSGGNIHMSKVGGSGAFTIKGSLTINGAGANVNLDSMTNAFTVDSGITINNGTLDLGLPGVATNLTVFGDININGGIVNGESGTIFLTGAWKKSAGTFNSMSGTVSFNGTTSQVITDNTAGGVNFNNVIINNANDIGMTYGVNINGTLTFIQGLFLTYASANLSIGPLGSIVGASQSTGWVARFSGGNLIRNITTTSPYLFAIGNINTYTPVTVTFSSVTTPGTVAMNTPGYNPDLNMPGIATYALSQTDYANWFWYIQQLSGTLGSYNADLNYGTASLQGSATVSTLHTGVYDGTNWTYPASNGSGTTVTATNITPLNGALENIGLANSTCTTPAVYNVTGTGSYCTGAGLPVGLDNSQTGVNYQLQTAGPINVGVPVAGTGSAISFGNQTMGTYTVVGTNAITSTCTNNMAGNAVITMGIPTAPTYTGIPPAEICINNTVNYTTQLGQSNYVWTVPGILGTDYTIVSGGIGSTNPTVNLTWLTSGTKTVTVNYTSGGCTGASPATNTTVVDTLPIPTFTIAPSGSICENSSVTYTTQTGHVFYNWTVSGISGTDYTITSGGLGNTDNTVTLTWLTNGSKTVTVNYYNNIAAFCAGATPANSAITVTALLTPTFTAQPGAAACVNTAVTYSTQAGQSNYTWVFDGTSGVDYSIVNGGTTTDYTVTLKWLTTGGKSVTVNYASGCSTGAPVLSTGTNVSTAVDASNLSITSATPACIGISGSTVTVGSTTLASQTYNVIYSLSAPNATNLATANMTFSGGTGTFTIPSGSLRTAGATTITITEIDGSGCPATGLSVTGSVTVNTSSIPTFTIEPGATACDHTDLTYTTQAGESNYIWNYSGILNTDYTITSGGSSADSSVTVQWLISTGNKTVTVNYANANGCTATNATSSTPTKINNCHVLPLFIPSGFVPNGKNPIWHIENSEDYPNMQVQIFDRWGHKIFECKGYTAWDGTFEGQNLSTGSYTYVINANDNRYKQVLKGTITIIR